MGKWGVNFRNMKIKNILITGDDGYNSIGTRLLVYYLKDKYNLKIAATKDQQSGVGGKINVLTGGKWGKTKVDSVEAIWADGTPSDAIECAVSYFKESFDLVISGINLGANISGSTISSGTLAAAWRSAFLKMAKKFIAISWYAPFHFIFKEHKYDDDLKDFLEHPGKNAHQVIDLSIKNDFWGADLLNINLPRVKSGTIKFTRFLPDIKEFYQYPVNFKGDRFTYPPGEMFDKNNDPINDGIAIRQGYISVTPCKTSLLDEKVFGKMKDKMLTV